MVRWESRRVRNHNLVSDRRGTIDESPRAVFQFRRVIDLLAAAVVGAVGLAGPVAAQVSAQPGVTVYTMGPGRIAAMVAVVVALIGAVIGGQALARAVRRIGNNGRRGARVALVLGPIGVVIGALVVAAADGGLGTGHGFGGGIVAMVIGSIGVTLGGLAWARSRRIA